MGNLFVADLANGVTIGSVWGDGYETNVAAYCWYIKKYHGGTWKVELPSKPSYPMTWTVRGFIYYGVRCAVNVPHHDFVVALIIFQRIKI